MGAQGAEGAFPAALARGSLAAWLLKRKSGSSVVRLRQYNKRYFVLDFERCVFFYSHSEDARKVSVPIPFAEIQDVQMAAPEAEEGDAPVEKKRTSLMGRLTRSGSGTSKESQADREIIVRTSDKPLELLCSTTAEAAQWLEAFREAMRLSGGQSSLPAGEREEESALPSFGGPSAAQPSRDPPPDLHAEAAAARAAQLAAKEEAAKEGHGVVVAEAQGGLFDFGAALEVSAPGGPAEAVGDGAEKVEDTGNIMQAADFGFGINEDSDEEADGPGDDAASNTSSLISYVPRGLPEESHKEARRPITPTSRPASAYADRHEGMSVADRLANLELSDCEDDDDDPLGLKAKT